MEKTIKVKETTLEMLKRLKEENNFSSIYDIIMYLIKLYREEKLRKMFGVDKGKITPFTRDDKIEDRDG
ncbi:VapB-type antitoxin [Sulfurisphaera ohwakuensis]|nr:VapB-type antitoxin [Sulfurisphaera ohwakuensis]MBB5252285.1 putative CopG family antitoxin [Sulfurisphaera ohwakuensis]